MVDKTYECTKIPNIPGTYKWGLVNKGRLICIRHGAHACIPHNVMFDRVAAEFGLDPVEGALRNDGCRCHDTGWVSHYQQENGFPRRLPNGRMHGMGFVSINEWATRRPNRPCPSPA